MPKATRGICALRILHLEMEAIWKSTTRSKTVRVDDQCMMSGVASLSDAAHVSKGWLGDTSIGGEGTKLSQHQQVTVLFLGSTQNGRRGTRRRRPH